MLYTLPLTPVASHSVISVLVISVELNWDALQQRPKLFGAVALCVGDKHAAGLTVRGVVEGHGNILGGPFYECHAGATHLPRRLAP